METCKNATPAAHRFDGIAVSNALLDVALGPSAGAWRSANDEPGITELVQRLQPLAPQLIVLEATGGLERVVVAALALAGLPVAVVNPRQVRDYAKATGRLAKTDALDAAALAHFAGHLWLAWTGTELSHPLHIRALAFTEHGLVPGAEAILGAYSIQAAPRSPPMTSGTSCS